jgi:hypothetical protein
MKNLVGFGLVMVVVCGCQRNDDMPVKNQLSFTMGSEMFDTYDWFYWNGTTVSVHFQSEVIGKCIISIETSHFAEVGNYIIDPFHPNIDDVITVSNGFVEGAYSTFQGIWSPC